MPAGAKLASMESAWAWKQYYAAERARIGRQGLLRMLEAAAPVDLDPTGATIVPHTRLEVTGHQVAAAVNAVVASGADRVLALGVLHGGRRKDGREVAAARAGDLATRERLRGVHAEDGVAAGSSRSTRSASCSRSLPRRPVAPSTWCGATRSSWTTIRRRCPASTSWRRSPPAPSSS